MAKLTFEIDCLDNTYSELEQYLLNLNGISKIKISEKIIDIEYDPKLINIELIKLEIFLFLDIAKIPSLLSFNKHPKTRTAKYSVIIEDICCEYCFKSIIQELLSIDGIVKASGDLYHSNTRDAVINIEYDDSVLSSEEVIDIVKKFNR